MKTMIVLTAEKSGYGLKTALIEKETYEADGNNPSQYFLTGWNAKEEGEVTIDGPGVDMIPDSIIEE